MIQKDTKQKLNNIMYKHQKIIKSNSWLKFTLLTAVAFYLVNFYAYYETQNMYFILFGATVSYIVMFTVLYLQKQNNKDLKKLQEEEFITKLYGVVR